MTFTVEIGILQYMQSDTWHPAGPPEMAHPTWQLYYGINLCDLNLFIPLF